MKKGKAIKLCIISQPFLAPFTHHKSLPSTPRDRTLMLKERCCLYTLSNHVIFSFLINIVLISVSVQHEKSVQQKKMIFRLVMSSRQKKKSLCAFCVAYGRRRSYPEEVGCIRMERDEIIAFSCSIFTKPLLCTTSKIPLCN